jgi:hypothetical protein
MLTLRGARIFARPLPASEAMPATRFFVEVFQD